MKRYIAILAALAAAIALPAIAQNAVNVTPSVTQGDGTITTVISWSTTPALTSGTPCTASGHPQWTGPKAGSGTNPPITISTSGTLPISLTCNFPGDSIVTYTWTPSTTNTDGSAYTNRNLTRIRHTLNPTLATNPLPACNAGGVQCFDLNDAGATRPTMHTVTGITGVATARGFATHVNSNGVESVASNVGTKSFTGSVPVTTTVNITVNPVAAPPTGFGAQ